MHDPNEKHWGDLVEKVKLQLRMLDPTKDSVSFHNTIWAAISEAFRRGQSTPPFLSPKRTP